MPYSFAFTADYTAPAALTSVAADDDTESIANVLTWDASADTYHEEYLVERQVGDDAWTEIGRTTDETFTDYLAPLNLDVLYRVSDSNGSQYSDPTETTGNLAFMRWAMTHVEGDEDFIQELRYVRPSGTTDMPLDQTVLQPLSGSDGDTQLPIVFVGQWQGERIGFQVQIEPVDAFLIDTFRSAALKPQGKIALKDPKGAVYLVQLGNFRKADMGAGRQLIEFDGIRIA